jgi:predicted nuclease of predicted toxin-antitoxin system
MRVLLDHNVNPRYARLLTDHDVSHTYKMGWAELLNGDLIAMAEGEGFDVMITADKNLQYQQSLKGRKICILVLNAKRITWPHIEPLCPQVQKILAAQFQPGAFIVVSPEQII